jgi:zinc transport system substrate-binding protein
MQPRTRRTFLKAGAVAALAGVSGCLGTNSSSDESQSGAETGLNVQSSFFVASDFTRQVAGDAATVESLVPFGQHGHGWEPGPDVQRAAADADIFVYVGEEFQPWADDIVANLETDAPDVSVVPIRHGVDLLPAPGSDGGHDEHNEHDEQETGEHDEHNEQGTGEHDEHNEQEGEHDEHDEQEGGHDGQEGGHDEHDHGTVDPHFWLDPTRAAAAVENVTTGLTDADPDNQETYESNAESFVADLEALDAEFEETLADRSRDVVLVAGHNAFQYLGHRYDFEVHALTGIAPDATPSPKAIREAQQVIEEHGVEHVLAPVFESDRAAQQLVEETDATDVLQVTPIPTIKPEWDEKGWGYLDVMREVNLDSLATALGAT